VLWSIYRLQWCAVADAALLRLDSRIHQTPRKRYLCALKSVRVISSAPLPDVGDGQKSPDFHDDAAMPLQSENEGAGSNASSSTKARALSAKVRRS
jgi:hypothetical protein